VAGHLSTPASTVGLAGCLLGCLEGAVAVGHTKACPLHPLDSATIPWAWAGEGHRHTLARAGTVDRGVLGHPPRRGGHTSSWGPRMVLWSRGRWYGTRKRTGLGSKLRLCLSTGALTLPRTVSASTDPGEPLERRRGRGCLFSVRLQTEKLPRSGQRTHPRIGHRNQVMRPKSTSPRHVACIPHF